MTDNIFFDTSKLKKIGKNVIIGKTVRIRYPELVEIGDNCIIDDFTYISTALKLGNNVHISSGTKIIGGKSVTVSMGNFSGTSPNAVLIAGSDDYLDGIGTPTVPRKYKANSKSMNMSIGNHSLVGANSTIITGVNLPDGACVGSNSLLTKTPNAFELWFGTPAKFLKNRKKESILTHEKNFLAEKNELGK